MMKKGIFVITIVISIALIIGGFYSYNSRINNLSKADKGKEVVTKLELLMFRSSFDSSEDKV